MALLMNVFFEDGFSEHYFPNLDNRKYPVAIRPHISGLQDELLLDIEVWNGVWRLNVTNQYTLLQGGDAVTQVELKADCVLEGSVRKTDKWFSIKIDEVKSDAMGFGKYLLHKEEITSLSIGSDEHSDIRYPNRFVTKNHAVMTFDKDSAYIEDKGSVNGTYINGRIVQGRTGVGYGDVVYILGLKIVYLGNLLAINNPGGDCSIRRIAPVSIPTFEDEAAGEEDFEEVYFLRTPRKLLKPDTEAVTIEKCPVKQEMKKQPMIFTIGPSFTMVIPIALAAMLSGGEGSMGSSIAMSAGAAGIGAIWAIVNARYSKKEEKTSEENRVRNYLDYIARIEEQLNKKTDYNCRVLNEQFPSCQEILHFTTDNTKRLWERSSSHPDFLSVRLGLGQIKSPYPIDVAKEDMTGTHDRLNDYIYQLKEKYSVLNNAPIDISLYEHRMVGVVSSNDEMREALIRQLSLQIAATHPYTDVRMCYIFRGRDLEKMDYVRWMPHTFTPDGKLRMMVCDSLAMGDVMFFLQDVIRERTEAEENNRSNKRAENEKTLPHYVIFISNMSIIEGEPISKYLLNPPEEIGMTIVYSADAVDKLPAHCNTIIQREENYSTCYSALAEFDEKTGFVFDEVSLRQINLFTRQMANFKVRDTASNAAIPDMLTFLDMYKVSRVEDLDIYHRWLENRTYESMKSMIGQKSGEIPLYLDIHEKYHGPHGLVAGTTGSGKSETLQSYILSLAINYHPHEVAFILIDYKGGGMAQSFVGLPHLAGIITNLGGNRTTRALLSINAEIKRRQAIFNEYKIKHIDAYIELYRNGDADEPMPHLLIIADEFAELKKEQPEFVRALVSAARVGRSLGINLILATQKPSGVIDDEIWSNTRFRICLRVANRQDSNEMLKRTDAAFITGTGRGFLQVGNDEIFEEFQSGWSGAPYTPELPFNDESKAKAQIINMIGKPEVKEKKKKRSDGINSFTQLDALVRYTEKLAKDNEVSALRQIWLAPLPSLICLNELDMVPTDERMLIPIGLADDPESQSQYSVSLDFIKDGHLLICGASGSGKTTLIQSVLYSAATRYSASQINFYIMDFSSRTMTVFTELPHAGCVCLEGMDEEIEKTMRFLSEELNHRKKLFADRGISSFRDYRAQYDDAPMILFVIDNYAAFNDSCEQYDDLLVQLSREAASYGIYMILSCNNSGDVRGRIAQNITKGIGLQLSDRFEYENVIGMRSEILPDDRICGRGLIKTDKPVEFQVAMPVDNITGGSIALALRDEFREKGLSGKSPVAQRMGSEIKTPDAEEFMNRDDFKETEENILILGEEADTGALIKKDLDKLLCMTVSGSGKSGKTNYLKYVAKQLKAKGCKVYLFDGVLKELESFAVQENLDGYMTDKYELFTFMQDILVEQLTKRNELVFEARKNNSDVKKALREYERIIVLINSATEFMEAAYDEEADISELLETVFEKGLEHKLHFIMAVSPKEYTDCYRYRIMRQYADWRDGIHLGDDYDEQGILDFIVGDSLLSRKLPTGAGLADKDGTGVLVVTPLIKEEGNG